MLEAVRCIECGERLSEERAELGYRYCTKAECQARHHRGLTITAVGVHKSGDRFLVADSDEIRRRGESGDLAKRDSGLGLDYRASQVAPAAQPQPPARIPTPRRAPSAPVWTAAQENLVWLYHDMGLSPRQIAQRARENTPKLQITERLATQILSARRRSRP